MAAQVLIIFITNIITCHSSLVDARVIGNYVTSFHAEKPDEPVEEPEEVDEDFQRSNYVFIDAKFVVIFACNRLSGIHEIEAAEDNPQGDKEWRLQGIWGEKSKSNTKHRYYY